MNKPQSISIVTKLECDSDFAYTKEAVRILTAAGVRVCIDQSFKYRLGEMRSLAHLVYSERELLESADMLLVLGGDGTMLDCCVRAAELAKPVAGINLGNLGFLTAMERDEMNRLTDIAEGRFTVENRMMLEMEITDRYTTHRRRALNDIVITSSVPCKLAELTLASGSGKLLDYRADGLIVATPTGSTAYSLSAGGPVVDPTASLLTVTPICSHSLLRGSVIFAPDTVLTVSGHTKDASDALCVTADGKNSIMLPRGTSVTVRKSEYTAGIVKLGEGRFYEILETKLNRK